MSATAAIAFDGWTYSGRLGPEQNYSFDQSCSAKSVPSHANQSEGSSVAHHRERISGKFPSRDTRNIPAFAITHGDYLKLVREAFRTHVGNSAKPAQVLADVLECSDKTTRSWLDGKTAPSGILDLRAINAVPAYAALKRKLAAQQSDLDPRIQETVQQLHALTLAIANGGAP